MFETMISRLARQGADHLRPGRRAANLAARDVGAAAERRLVAGVERQATGEVARKAALAADRSLVKEVASKAEKAVLKNPTLRNQVTLHVDARDAHKALLESIRTAEKSFYIETFIWHNDAAGNEVLQALAERVQRAKAEGKTFDAKVLIDWFGLRQGTGGASDTEIVSKLKAAGVEAVEFARGYVDEGKLIPITHRKFYIKDGSQFMTGGRNIGDEYLKGTFTNPKGVVEPHWHDLLYTVQGDETGRVIDEFFRNWKRAGGQAPAFKPTILPHPTGRVKIESFITDPHVKIRTLAKAHLDLIANAQREIVVIYPYLSDDALIDALIAAKRKNPALSLKVILPAGREATSEGGVYSLLNKGSARELMAAGAEVRMFAGGTVDGKPVTRFSHFKGMTVDGEIVSIGSANGDARTFRANHELNTVIADRATARDFFNQVVGPDWAAARPLTQAELRQDSAWTRIKQFVLELVDGLL